jgi:hypothetical protein
MKPEQIEVQTDDFARIWKVAHLQRSEDISVWLKQLFQKRRQVDKRTPVSPAAGRILATG